MPDQCTFGRCTQDSDVVVEVCTIGTHRLAQHRWRPLGSGGPHFLVTKSSICATRKLESLGAELLSNTRRTVSTTSTSSSGWQDQTLRCSREMGTRTNARLTRRAKLEHS